MPELLGDFHLDIFEKDPRVSRLVNDKQYRNAVWGLFRVTRVSGSRQYLEESFSYKIGEPIRPLREDRYYRNISEFCAQFYDKTINHIGDIKLDTPIPNGLLVLILEPSLLYEEDVGMIYA